MTVFRYSAEFYKKGDMVYISHLDLMSLMRRAIRRARLPFILTGGFTPRVKISLPTALGLGKESGAESAVLWFKEEIPEKEVMERLNPEFPEGIRLIAVKKGIT